MKIYHRIGNEIPENNGRKDKTTITELLDQDWAVKMVKHRYTPDVSVKLKHNPSGICAVYFNPNTDFDPGRHSYSSDSRLVGYLERIRITTGRPPPHELERLKRTDAKNLETLTAEGTHANYDVGGDTIVLVHWGIGNDYRNKKTLDIPINGDVVKIPWSVVVLHHIVKLLPGDFTYSPGNKKNTNEPSYAAINHIDQEATPGLRIENAREEYGEEFDVVACFYEWNGKDKIKSLFPDFQPNAAVTHLNRLLDSLFYESDTALQEAV